MFQHSNSFHRIHYMIIHMDRDITNYKNTTQNCAFFMQYITTGNKEPHRKMMLEINKMICILMHNTAMGF